MDKYVVWDCVPEHLLTRKRLSERGLRPGPAQVPSAVFVSYVRGRNRPVEYPLFDVCEAVEKKKPTEAQLVTLEKARGAALAARTCRQCRLVEYSRKQLKDGLCWKCADHMAAVVWAREVLADQTAIILDTETTGLGVNDQVVEIGLLGVDGRVVLDTLVRPTCEISAGALALHGIDNEMVASAPAWPEVCAVVGAAVRAAGAVVMYNAEFDLRVLRQTRNAHGLPKLGLDRRKVACAMKMYAQWSGEWNEWYQSYKWQSLDGGHRALEDCRAVLDVIMRMALDEMEVQTIRA